MSQAVREGTVQANGISHAYLETGSGPLILLLHGFPDNAWTWDHQLEAFGQSGFRAVAPFLRGYPPTEVPLAPFDSEDVADDVHALIGALGEEAAFVMGHDWGALATFNAAALYPEKITKAVAIGVGHPRTAIEIFKSPGQLHYSFHIWLFQLEGFAEYALRNDDFALIDYLWDHWSEQPVDADHVKRVKKTFNEPGAVEAALAYYRGLVRIPEAKPRFFERATKNTTVGMLVVYGGEDPARAISRGEQGFFDGAYRRELVEGAGHFVHRERPEELTRLALDWFSSS